MYPVHIFCCGEIIACHHSLNVCDMCGSEYNLEGDRVNHVFPWELNFDLIDSNNDVIFVKEGVTKHERNFATR